MDRPSSTQMFFILMLLTAFSTSLATQKVYHLKQIDTPILIDGVIDSGWQTADSVSDFIQQRPYYNAAPSRRTTARLLTTENALYCLLTCWDEPKNIQRHRGNLDDFGGDVVSLMIDTFGDQRTAYKFAVSASGVRSDCRLLDDARNRDYNWDGVWFSASAIYDWGFVVEMEIPYRSIQYNEKLTEWGLDFDRWIAAISEDLYWCQYEENEGQRISKFGKLVFDDFKPSVRGLNLEIYPVGIAKADYSGDSNYDISPNAGVDLFYNPSQQLTLQFTANPDFAQIEADPYDFNITRYESYFEERRPFFTEGNEVFMPSGRERGSGFYRPMELFYSRRIGKKLPDGSEVPLQIGTRAFGRWQDWEYGGFVAMTGEKDYSTDDGDMTEPRAFFSSVRLKRQIMKNSSIGILYVGKNTPGERNGVLDVDGAFRASSWQCSYQIARSYKNSQGDFAASTGMILNNPKFVFGFRGKYVGKDFDVSQVGFVPWKGTWDATILTGPRWYFKEGALRSLMLYTGGLLLYERVDDYMDHVGFLGLNMQFRRNWGYEINFISGNSKDEDVKFRLNETTLNAWFNISPQWMASIGGDFSKAYNFSRNYLGYFLATFSEMSWRAVPMIRLGTTFNMYVEYKPDRRIEEITYNARPFFSFTPVNNMTLRLYVDNVWTRSSQQIERLLGGFLFSYNFRPKSWIYFAVNDIRDRSDEYNAAGRLLPNRLHTLDRVSVLKLKYLFYF